MVQSGKKILSAVVKIVATLGAATIVLGLISWIYLSSQSGNDALLRWLNNQTDGESGVRFEGLNGPLFSAPSLDRVTFSDDQGIWLDIRSVSLDWSPLALVFGELNVRQLGAEKAIFIRPPRPGAAQSDDVTVSSVLPSVPFDLNLQTFEISSIDVKASAFGLDAEVFGRGALTYIESEILDLTATLSGKGRFRDSIAVSANYLQSTQFLSAHADVNAPRGGLFAKIAGVNDNYGVDIKFAGDGPVGDWRGKLNATVEGAKVVEADVSLNKGAFAATARLDGGELIPQEGAALLGRKATFSLQIAAADPIGARSVIANLEADTVRLNAAGTVSATTVTAPDSINYSIEILDPRLIKQFSPQLSMQPFEMRGEIKDIARSLVATGAVDQVFIEYADQFSSNVTTEFELARSTNGFQLSANGYLSDIKATAFDASSGVLPSDARWALKARNELGGNFVALESVSLASDLFQIDGAGRIALADQTSALNFTTQLHDVSVFTGSAVNEGRAQVDLSAKQKVNAWQFDGSIAATDLAWQSKILNEVIGPQPAMHAELSYLPDQKVEIANLTISGDHIEVAGNATIQDQLIQEGARLRVALSNLDEIDSLQGFSVAGGVQFDARLSGRAASPDAHIKTHLNSLDMQSLQLRDLALNAEIGDLVEAPNARLSLTGKSDWGEVSADTKVRSDTDGSAFVDDLLTTIGPYRLTGHAQKQPGKPIVGSFELQTRPSDQDLLPLGSISGNITLGDQSSIQQIIARVQTAGMQIQLSDTDVLQIREANMSSDVLFEAEPNINIRLIATDVSHPQLVADKLTLTLAEGLHDLAWTLSAEKGSAETYQFNASGRVRRDGNAFHTQFGLNGNIGQTAIASVDPFVARYEPKQFSIAPFRLSVGQGFVSGNVNADVQSIALAMALEEVNVSVLDRFVSDLSLGGKVNGNIGFTATSDEAAGKFKVSLTNLTSETGTTALDRDLRLEFGGEFADERLAIEARTELEDSVSAKASAQVPLVFSFENRKFDIPKDKNLQASVVWDGAIGAVWPIFEQLDHDLDGLAHAKLNVTGTLINPVLDGAVTLQGGRYESTASGFVAEDIGLTASIRDRTLTIDGFEATDGADGLVSLSGSSHLNDDLSVDANFNIETRKARLIRRPQMTVLATSNLTFVKDGAQSRLFGNVTIDSADVGAVKPAQNSVPILDVREINGTDTQTGTMDRQASTLLTPVELQISFRAPGKLFIRSYGLDSEWSSAVDIGGTSAAPTFNGGAQIVRGTFDFLGKRFDFTQGNLAFQGADASDPLLDLRAELSLPDLTAVLSITGSASAPKLAITSSPSFPEEEVLARIFFGTSVASLSPVEAVQLASTINALNNGGGQGLIGNVRKKLGIDRLAFGQSDERDFGTTITGGKYLTNNIYVEVTTAPATGETASAVEVGLTKNLSLITRRTLDHDNNLAIRWSWNY